MLPIWPERGIPVVSRVLVALSLKQGDLQLWQEAAGRQADGLLVSGFVLRCSSLIAPA